MKVTNNTPHVLVANVRHTVRGPGPDTEIPPGETIEIKGQPIKKVGDEEIYIELSGQIRCHEGPDDGHGGFHVEPGKPLSVGSVFHGVIVRYLVDEQVVEEQELTD